ncbi:MAG: sugar phosphate isomerase/epimerase [Lentisphaerae bacterium]|nr:sugar phosphate isomerase/epimerase [Lentisphaerota bacterium]
MKHILVGSAVACAAVLSAVAGEKTVGTGDAFKGPVGLQLYSLRDSFKKDVPGTLDAVKALGFKYVELAGTYGLSAGEFRTMLDARGLVAIAGHFPMDRYLKDPDGLAKEAKELGLQYTGVAWYGHKSPLDEAQCLKMAADFNAAGKNMAERGLKFYYHNHGYEFHPHGDGTLFDLLMAKTDPNTVFFQMDVLWTLFPGQDPAKLMAKYGPRWHLVHLKDLRKGVQGDMSGKTPVTNDVALGTGQVDYAALLKAAQKAGVKWYFIEDESPTVTEQLPVSLKFLSGISW